MQNKILNKSGWWIISFLTVLPVIMWAFDAPLSQRFSSLSAISTGVGQIFGLSGFALFSCAMILSARIKLFEKFFGNLNETYFSHHFIGGVAFSLLLIHPLLLAYNYLLVSYRAAAMFFLPSAGNLPQAYGTIGLALMIIFLFITFYTKIKYQVWKFTHKFMGLAFVFAFLHTLTIGFDVAQNPALKYYFFVLGSLGILAFLYRALFNAFLVKRYDYSFVEAKNHPDSIYELEFAPKGREIKFSAGQYVFIKLYSDKVSRESQPFSISSSPGKTLKIAIKELGDYTEKIKYLKAGERAKIEGPYGSFIFRNYDNKKQIWIAGGVGITPFLSMLRDLKPEDSGYKIDLFYSVKDRGRLAFKEEIEYIKKSNNNLNVVFWPTDTLGFLTAEFIARNIDDAMEKDVLICGPGIMMKQLKEQFLKIGINKNAIHTEEFKLY